MKKLNELEEQEKDSITDYVYSTSSKLAERVETVNSLNKFGICGECDSFMFAESEFSVEFAKCMDFSIRLNQKSPIINCSSFIRKNALTLNQMLTLAMVLDFSDNKDKVGF